MGLWKEGRSPREGDPNGTGGGWIMGGEGLPESQTQVEAKRGRVPSGEEGWRMCIIEERRAVGEFHFLF